MCSFTVFPSAAVERRVLVQHRLHVILARRHILQTPDRIAPRPASTTVACPGFHPSTFTPNTICVRGVSSIWLRGSSCGSVERTSNTRPSSACALKSLGNETENDCPTAESGKQRTRPIKSDFMIASLSCEEQQVSSNFRRPCTRSIQCRGPPQDSTIRFPTKISLVPWLGRPNPESGPMLGPKAHKSRPGKRRRLQNQNTPIGGSEFVRIMPATLSLMARSEYAGTPGLRPPQRRETWDEPNFTLFESLGASS